MPPFLRPTCHILGSAILATTLLAGAAQAQVATFGQPYDPNAQSSQLAAPPPAATPQTHGGEHFHSKGRRSLPPGYQEAPSNDFEHGPDPDHLEGIERDKNTGANLSKFGSSYQNSNNVQSGQVGDATGNGWVAPRGNGW